jgi:hypothetical protein
VPFLAEATLDIAQPPEVVFDKLADHDGWPAWMPASFAPTGRSLGVLKVGHRPRVRIAGAPLASPIEISIVERPTQLAWKGAAGKWLFAEHRFTFEAIRSGTRVCSIETWDGHLAQLARPAIRRVAERVALEMLEALSRSLR